MADELIDSTNIGTTGHDGGVRHRWPATTDTEITPVAGFSAAC